MRKKVTTIVVAMVMMFIMSISAYASEGVLISIPANQVWTSGIALTRVGTFNYVTVSLDSVYPLEGKDDFHRIQARLTNSIGHVVSESGSVLLTEGAGSVQIDFKPGFGNTNPVYLQFRGNSNEAAKAVVNYDAH